jgi:phage shock protein PspC (stress-responsive transcriptional regulator)
MAPFEFIILFFSFIYTLALTHLLFAITRMIRHRRELIFSWPHALWMLSAFLFLIANWISDWDFHRLETITLTEFAGGLVFVILQYFICALVAPDFDDNETFDMRAFHDREGRTYITAILVAAPGAVAINLGAGTVSNVQNWGEQDGLAIGMALTAVVALIVRARWAQIASPLVFSILEIGYLVAFYPVLRSG